MRRELDRHGYEGTVDRVRTGPPIGPMRIPAVRHATNLIEYFVHHEDVRRALGEAPRELSAAYVNALWRRTRQMVPLLLMRSPVRVVHVLPDGRRAALGHGARTVVLRGAAPELALHAFGRGAKAELTAEGLPEDIAALDRVLPLPA